MTMEYIDGIKVTDVEKIRKQGFCPQKIAHIVSDAFGRMIFCDGFVHCDPHPGNLFVRSQPGDPSKPQLVILDHGLYRELDESFRVTFCNLWTSILQRDMSGVQKCATALGARPYAKYFPLIFTLRPLESRSRFDGRLSPEERRDLKQELKKLDLTNVTEFMKLLPRDMLFVFRITNLVRALNKAVQVDQIIPPEFYAAVAELINTIYKRTTTATG